MRRTIISSISLLLISAGLLAAADARADGTANVVSLRVSSAFVASPSFDPLSERDLLVQVELSYARELFELWEGRLLVEGSWSGGSTRSKLFDEALQTKAFLQAVTVGARYSVPVWSWFVPHLRVGLGVAVGSLELSGEGLDPVSDRSAAFTGYLLAGFELLWPRRFRRSFTGGLVVEGGYSFASPLAFDLAPEPSEKNREIPLRGSGLGSLNLNAPLVRVGVVFHF